MNSEPLAHLASQDCLIVHIERVDFEAKYEGANP